MYIPLLKPILRMAGMVVSILLYAATILAAYGGRFDTQFFTFPAIMTLALPYLAIATLIVTIIWFACGRLFAGGLGVVAILCSWGPISTVSPFGRSSKGDPDAQKFTILTYNMIHGWDQEHKDSTANRTIEYLINSNADIINIQELISLDPREVTGMTDDQKRRLREAYPYMVGDKNSDIKVFSKYPIVYEDGRDYVGNSYDKKRYAFFRLDIKGRELTLVNVHLMSFLLTEAECQEASNLKTLSSFAGEMVNDKSPMREKFQKGFRKRREDVKTLRKALDNMQGAVIVCGDFNDVPESYAYRLLKGEDMRDAYVETGFGPLVTYNAHRFWFHLDQIFYRGPLKALDVRKGRQKLSDHYPLVATFQFDDEQK